MAIKDVKLRRQTFHISYFKFRVNISTRHSKKHQTFFIRLIKHRFLRKLHVRKTFAGISLISLLNNLLYIIYV